ncbi:MAG TPA: hypothetical protein VHR86_09790 [Armatimonadota bacterium]|nr:hypothetical protein [Armatimonadota bacterium]
MTRSGQSRFAVEALLCGTVFLLAAALALTPFDSHDLWWHLRSGSWIWQHGHPARENLFSFTAPHAQWVTHEWLSEALFYWFYNTLGQGTLVALKAILVGATFALVFLNARLMGGSSWLAALATLIAVYASRFTFDIRPQLFTYLFLALCLFLVNRQREQGGRCYVYIPLFVLWANLHSGFIAGLGLLALAAITTPKRARFFGGALLLSGVSVLLTPNTWRGVWFPLAISRTRLFMDNLTEWFSPNFHSSWLFGFEVLLLVSIAILTLSPRRPRLLDIGLFLAFAHLALQNQRHVTLFAIAVAPMLAQHATALLNSLFEEWRLPPAWERATALATLLCAAILLGRAIPWRDGFAIQTGLSRFPSGAAVYLRYHPAKRMYNSYCWGGYLIWELYPAGRVFIDGRADAYPEQIFRDYLAVERLQPGWQSILQRYGIDTVVYTRGSALCAALRVEPGWKLVYADAVAEIYRRAPARQLDSSSLRGI